jgi:excisionase family DNA binding protein
MVTEKNPCKRYLKKKTFLDSQRQYGIYFPAHRFLGKREGNIGYSPSIYLPEKRSYLGYRYFTGFFPGEHLRGADKQAMEAENRDLLTVEQAANYLQLSQSSIRSYIRQGKLKAFRVAGKRKVLIPKQALMDLLEPARGDLDDLDDSDDE